MNKIEQLLQQHCPNGVEWKTLGEVAELKRGTSITKKTTTEGKYPVVSGGQQPAYYIDQYNRSGETITIAGSGAYAGFVMYWNEPIFVSDAFSIKADVTRVLLRYIYHFLLNIQNKIHELKTGGGVPHVYAKDVACFPIPLPPLAVQEEIVRILDTFTTLEAELELRKKQYEYYRDSLLTMKITVETYTLKDLFDTRNGYTPSTSNPDFWENGTIPWFVMEDIRENGRILSESKQHITNKAVKKSGLFPANSIIVATSATIGEHALITTDFLCNQRFTCLSPKAEYKNKIDIKYIFYYAFKLDEFCKNNTTKSSFSSVDMSKFYDFEFPLPPLSEQKRIADILDKFDTLTASISEGLPKEIALRKKQYEYYREKLLSFPKMKEKTS
ncbi:restriction endonuclease subunit S [Treponema pedis]|uniref:Restriction endonuclease subunit S n=1 Tax=Treponema pedis TaxID=409322 RepID=A0A7S6WP58_9SPIR|nr:restriction endonuclease subunit S [Treponema pedis]QOW60760.1 restriction endonuclease subunit S [Treponema pedis]